MHKNMVVIGAKEIFTVRALIKKANEAGAQCEYASTRIDEINEVLHRLPLIVFYIDEIKIREEVLSFLIDKMKEKGLKMILAGDGKYIGDVFDRIPRDLMIGSFVTPIDNERFVDTINDYFTKVEIGEYKKKVLIVDDDSTYLRTVSSWLSEDYRVSAVNSGLRAIKWLGKNKVDLILLDHEMPVTTGPHFLEMLRSDSDTADIPVMFLTGRGDRESVMKVVDLKPEAYFLKDICKEELLEKLSEFFKNGEDNESDE